MHKVDAVLENLGWAPEGRSGSRLVLGNLNRGKHRAIHPLKSDEVASGIDYGDVHLPIPLLGFRHSCVNYCLGSVQRYWESVGHIEWNFAWDGIQRIR